MKKALILIFILCCSSIAYTSDISDNYTKKYDALVPPESSSVHSDYLFEQIALGSQYTILLLDQISEDNGNLNQKVDIMIEKFNILIEQNKKIIKLLEVSSKDSDS